MRGQLPPRGALRVRAVLWPLEVAYDHSGLDPAEAKRKIQAGPQGIWRYADFLPFGERPVDPLQPGLTPLLRADRLGARLGLDEVWVKNDAANPTHSFKDRVVAVAIAKARELGFETVACASTGNLANAVAAHAAAAGLDSYVFVPADLEEQKLLATGVHGTHLVGVKGSYDDVNRLCTELCESRPWAFVNVNLRPYYSEGSKTIGYEIAEQLGWSLPDRIVCPIASGSLFTRIAKGLEEWRSLGLVEGELPSFNGAQAAGCDPVATAFREGEELCRPQRPRRSPRASRSETRPTGPTRSSSPARPGARSMRSTTTRSGPASACSPDDRDVHRDRRRGHHRGPRQARRRRRDRARRAGRCGDHRRRPEDARRGSPRVRDRRDRRLNGVVRGHAPRGRAARPGGALSGR